MTAQKSNRITSADSIGCSRLHAPRRETAQQVLWCEDRTEASHLACAAMRPRDAAYSIEQMWRQGGPCSLGTAQAAYEERSAVPARGGANRSTTLENSGTGGHMAPQICAPPAALSQKTWQPLGPANWAGRYPQTRRALRVTAAREQSLENNVLRSESPSGRPEARAAAKSCRKHHLLLP